MALPIEDYALIGDTHTGALVGRDGSIDWLCLPRFDAGACFAALLGEPEHGRWRLAPAAEVSKVRRRYREDSLVLETEMETADGTVRIVDCMPHRDHDHEGGDHADVARVVEGVSGRVPMRMELVVRFEYGQVVPWAQRRDEGLQFVAGPDALLLVTPVETHGENLHTVAEFAVEAGDRVPFTLLWHRSHHPAPKPAAADDLVEETTEWWRQWTARGEYDGLYADEVRRSLVTLKALTYEPTGGIVAAATTSLPEELGGGRNWDYRYCWLRDATFALHALLHGGYRQEAVAWRDWLLRAVAGRGDDLQVLYGPAGERAILERELDALPGYEGSRPVRIGNAACAQFQLDIYGEVLDTLHHARRAGIEPSERAWAVEVEILDFLESHWQEPDNGIWEVRGEPRQFTHSKVMAWVAIDRAVKTVESGRGSGPVDDWRKLRDAIHEEVCQGGYNAETGTFVQYYGSDALDASLLMMPLVGFLPADDERVVRTVDAVQERLTVDGFVARYRPDEEIEGVRGEEGTFLMCSFWMVQTLAAVGRHDEATALFERLLEVRNDVGLLSEQYEPETGRFLGNFPQAFSHVGLVNAARALQRPDEEPERTKD